MSCSRKKVTSNQHPIDVASRANAINKIFKWCKTKKPIILDVGCLNGDMLDDLKGNFPDAFIIGSDIDLFALNSLLKNKNDFYLLQFDITKCPLANDSVNCVVILNVLEHIYDDFAAILQIVRILVPNGIVVIEVPFGPKLFDGYDVFWKHYRRYSLKQIKNIVSRAGLNILEITHIGFFVYPFFWIRKKIRRYSYSHFSEMKTETLLSDNSRTDNSMLFRNIMKFETFLGRYINYPIGIRCCVVCQKR